jgi:hypothetical protein
MATERQLAANRRNANKSTGPRSSAGKRRASQNARRHGFAAGSFRGGDPKQIEALARQIAGETTNPLILEHARAAAQATFDLAQIRRAKVELIATGAARSAEAPSLQRVGTAPPSDSDASNRAIREAVRDLLKLDRHEKRAAASRSRCHRTIYGDRPA